MKGPTEFERPHLAILRKRMAEPRKFLQVLIGPRQVGKTTLARQLLAQSGLESHFASADAVQLRDPVWIEQQWEIARVRTRESGESGTLFVLDEVQKVPHWSETVKQLWDADTAEGLSLRVLLLGSTPLLIQQGLTESLAGRFESLRLPHWSFGEMRDAFGWSLDQFIFYGGYPGAAHLIDDPERWEHYLLDSLVETTMSRDVFLMTRVDKPALFRRVFQLACAYSGQILSYQKMVGQLQEAGNTTTVAHYLDLLTAAGFVTGIQKFAGEQVRRRASSPKLQVLNNALMTVSAGLSFVEARSQPDRWGRYVESAVGAHLLNSSSGTSVAVHYWRRGNHEVDFVLSRGNRVTAIEVKSGSSSRALPGMTAFRKLFDTHRVLLVGRDGLSIEEFLSHPASHWLE